MNYVEIVGKLKETARDFLRSRWIVGALTKLESLKADVKSVEESIKQVEKRVAINKYKISKLDKDDPEFEDKKKTFEEALEFLAKDIEALNKAKKEAEDAVAEQDKHIKQICDGTLKVNLVELNDYTTELLDARAKEIAKQVK